MDKSYTYLKTQTGVTATVSNGRNVNLSSYSSTGTFSPSILGNIEARVEGILSSGTINLTVKINGTYTGTITKTITKSNSVIYYSELSWSGTAPQYGQITGFTASIKVTGGGYSSNTLTYNNSVEVLQGQKMLPVVYGVMINPTGNYSTFIISGKTTPNQLYYTKYSNNTVLPNAKIVVTPLSGASGSSWVQYPPDVYDDIKRDYTITGMTDSNGLLTVTASQMAATLYKVEATYNGSYLYSDTACTTPVDGRYVMGFFQRNTNTSPRTYYAKASITAKTYSVYIMLADETDMYSQQKQIVNSNMPIPSVLNTYYNTLGTNISFQLDAKFGNSTGTVITTSTNLSSSFTGKIQSTYSYTYYPKNSLMQFSLTSSKEFVGMVNFTTIPNSVGAPTITVKNASIKDNTTLYDDTGLKLTDIFEFNTANGVLYNISSTESQNVYVYAIPVKYKDIAYKKSATYKDLARRALCTSANILDKTASDGTGIGYFLDRTNKFITRLESNLITYNPEIFNTLNPIGLNLIVNSNHDVNGVMRLNTSSDLSTALNKSLNTGATFTYNFLEPYRFSNDSFKDEKIANIMRKQNVDNTIIPPTVDYGGSDYDTEDDTWYYNAKLIAGSSPIVKAEVIYYNESTYQTTDNSYEKIYSPEAGDSLDFYSGLQSINGGSYSPFRYGWALVTVYTVDGLEYVYTYTGHLVTQPELIFTCVDDGTGTGSVRYTLTVKPNNITVYKINVLYKKSSVNEFSTLELVYDSTTGSKSYRAKTGTKTIGESGDYDFKLQVLYGDGNIIESNVVSVNVEKNCCFRDDTLVLMADGTEKPICKIKEGDLVKSYNKKTGDLYTTIVKRVILRPESVKMAFIELDDYTIIDMTQYHPLLTTNGWHSITNYRGLDTLTENDEVMTINGPSKIMYIHLYNSDPIITYNLDVVDIEEDPDIDDDDNFIANGIIVHNGC